MLLKLLSEEQIKEGALELLDYKPLAKLSDFARKIGGGKTWITSTNRTKQYPHPKSEGSYEQVVVNALGELSAVNMNVGHLGIRPAVDFSEIEKECVEVEEKFGLTFVEYGEYPQSKATNVLELEKALKDGTIKETNKKYSVPNHEHENNIHINPWYHNQNIEDLINNLPEEHIQYPGVQFNQGNGGLYFPPGVRYFNHNHTLPNISHISHNNPFYNPSALDKKEPYKEVPEYQLEDGSKYVKVDNEWFKVEPITWRVDKEKNIAVSESIISGGVPINKVNDYLSQRLTQDIKDQPVKEETKSSIDKLDLNIDFINIIIQIGFSVKDDKTPEGTKEEVKEETQKVIVKVK